MLGFPKTVGRLNIHFQLRYSKRLLFVIEMESVYCAVRTEPLNSIRLVSGFEVQTLFNCDHSMRGGCNYGNGFGMAVGKVIVVCANVVALLVTYRNKRKSQKLNWDILWFLGVCCMVC
jgi:hypothetical protein